MSGLPRKIFRVLFGGLTLVEIGVRLQNDAPVVSDVLKSGVENNPVTFDAADFTNKFFDIDGDSLTKIKVVSLPSSGFLKLSGRNVIADQEIVTGRLNAMTFHPESNWYGSTSFSWKGSDRFLYSNDQADVKIIFVVAESSSSEESDDGHNYHESFCDKYWWSCYVVGPVVAIGCVAAIITASIMMYLHKKKMLCFRNKEYLIIN